MNEKDIQQTVETLETKGASTGVGAKIQQGIAGKFQGHEPD